MAEPDEGLARRGAPAMIVAVNAKTDPAEHARIRAAESRIEFNVAGAFTILIAGTLAYVHMLFADIVPPARLWAWTAMVIAAIVVMVVLPLAVLVRRPDDAEIMALWSPLGKFAAILFDAAVAASVWLLLPYASEPLRLLMVVFYAACVSGQVISTAESLGTITFGVVSIFGSAALFFVMAPGPYSVGLALFLVAFGALMIGVAATLKIAIRSAIAARLAAEAISADLAAALAAATEARQAKTRFIAAATHDLRQPLQAAALFFNRIAARQSAAGDPAVVNARLAFAEAAGLLDQLLEHLRLDGGMIRPEVQHTELGAVIPRVCAEVAEIAAVSAFRIDQVGTGLAVQADPALLVRILRNLLHNAMRHSRGSRILVGARRRGDRVRIYVVDNGRGISTALAADLFEDVKAHGPDPVGQKGVGLGLPSSRRMAELMGGSMGLDPVWRHGAAVYCELPLMAAGGAQSDPGECPAVMLNR